MIAAALGAQQATDPAKLPLPKLRGDLVILETNPDESGQPRWQIYDSSRNRYFLLSYPAYLMYLAWPLAENLGGLVKKVNRWSIRKVTVEESYEFMRFLQASQLFLAHTPRAIEALKTLYDSSRTNILKKAVHHYLFFRIPVLRPDRFLTRTVKYVRFAFTAPFWLATAFVGLIAIYLTSKQLDVYFSTLIDFFSVEGVVLYGLFLVVAKVMHEFGHAYAAKHYGCEVPTMGVAFLVMWPVLYTDGTALWRLRSRRRRLTVNFAGVVVELWLTVISLMAWNLVPDGPLRSACFAMATVTMIGTLLVNLNFFMRFDGYYILSDFLGIENLQNRAFDMGKWRLRRFIFGLDDPPPEAVSRRREVFLVSFAFGIWIYRFFLFLGIALLVYHLFFKILGIVLFGIEIIYFIGKPIYNELSVWWKVRDKVKWRYETVRSAIIASLVLLALLLPWQSRVRAPAVLEQTASATVFAPEDAVVVGVMTHDGQLVSAGDVLLTMRSPIIDAAVDIETIELAANAVRLRRAAASSIALENLQVAAQERQNGLARLDALKERRTSLMVRAPIGGKVTDLDPSLKPGLWLEESTKILQLIAPRAGARVIGYVDEEDLLRIQTGKKAVFIPKSSAFSKIPLTVASIDKGAVPQLHRPDPAAPFGGEISVATDKPEALRPTQSLYRVTLTPDDGFYNTDLLLLGGVFIDAERESPLLRFLRFAVAIVILESGF